jgi:hypothetical protein
MYLSPISLTSVVAAIACVGVAGADLLTFEDLMPWDPPIISPGVLVMAPDYHGFRFTSVSLSTQSAEYNNTWVVWGLDEEFQIPNCADNWHHSGKWSGYVSGERMIGNFGRYQDPPNTWTVTRADGGLWSFDGASFTGLGFSTHGLAIRGYLGETEVLGMNNLIVDYCGPIFASPGGQISIDRLVISPTVPWGVENGFAMDDFNYTLVPSPAPLALLGLAGLLCRRRRK